MEKSQAFRIAGTTDIVSIGVFFVNGQSVIYWADIEELFRDVACVKNGGKVVPLLRDSTRKRIQPHCIAFYPGSILDVILRNASEHGLDEARVSSRNIDLANGPARAFPKISVAQPEPDLDTPSHDKPEDDDFATLPAISEKAEDEVVESLQVSSSTAVKLASQMAAGFDGHVHLQQLHAELVSMVDLNDVHAEQWNNPHVPGENNQAQHKNLEEKEKEENDLRAVHNDGVRRLAVLEGRIQAVLTQTLEPHESPVPRLFVLLPQDPSAWDAVNPYCSRFMLHFLCDCGEFNNSTDDSPKIPNHIHIAKHEGYRIARPSEFIQQYGPYVLTILHILKNSLSIEGVTIPSFSGLEMLSAKEHQLLGIHAVLNTLDTVLDEDGESNMAVTGQLGVNEALLNADLRKLETFWVDVDGTSEVGNLHRIITEEGFAKWVCIDHYREIYPEKIVKALQNVLDLRGGTLDEVHRRVKVTLRSSASAEEVYATLAKATFVRELDICFDWECTGSDLRALEDALRNSQVSTLRLDIRQSNLGTEFMSTFAKRGTVLCVEELPNMKMIHLILSPQLTDAQRRRMM
ncbi:unnamed protein product [Mortierella alpina]